MALFPSLILYSCLILRETYICFLLLALQLNGHVIKFKIFICDHYRFLGATLLQCYDCWISFFVIFIFIQNIKVY